MIGNPPYIRIQTLREFHAGQVEYLKRRYHAGSKGNFDIYVLFVERGLELLNGRGRLGFILPNKFFNAQYGQPLRELLSKGRHVSHIVHFGDRQVFHGASTYTSLLFLEKSGTETCKVVRVGDLVAWASTRQADTISVLSERLSEDEWHFPAGGDAALYEKLRAFPARLEDVTSRIFQGIKTSADKVYIVDEVRREPGRILVHSSATESEHWLEPDLLHPLVKGGDSKRYSLTRTRRLILFPYAAGASGTAGLISPSELETRYPLTWAYLQANKAVLEARENGKMRGEGWYGYGRTQALDVVSLPKIFTPDIALRASFSLDETGEVFFTGGVAGGYGILVRPDLSREYVLGLLNSKLLDWFLRQIATQMRGGYFSYEARFIRQLPIRTVEFSNPTDKARHDKMVNLVQTMLDLHKRLAAAKTAYERTMLQRQITATDHRIDQLVYDLYGLTPEEIKIVEELTEVEGV